MYVLRIAALSATSITFLPMFCLCADFGVNNHKIAVARLSTTSLLRVPLCSETQRRDLT